MPASEVSRIHNDPSDPRPVWSSGLLLTHVDQVFASALLAQVGADTNPPWVATEIRHLGEATERDVEGGSAVGGRASRFTLSFVAGGEPELFRTVVPAAVDRLIGTLHPWISAETNINFAGRPKSAEHVASAWPPLIFTKLAEIRRRYDPQCVLAPTPIS